MKPKRVILVGGSGFIGRKLAIKLETVGFSIVSLSSQDIDLVDDSSVEKLPSILKEGDTVVMLAALTPDKGKGVDTFRRNILMAENVSEAVKNAGVAHVVYFSSDAVYSLGESVVDESTKPSPEDLYGAMHLSREFIFKSIGLPLTILRPTLIYGHGDTHNSYGPNRFIRQALNDRKIPLFGEGEEKRSHIYIDDLCNMVCKVIENKYLGVLNLATEPSISFMELAKKISKITENNCDIITSERNNPITYRHFDVSKLTTDFPEISMISLDEGILKMINEETERRNETVKSTQKVA